MLERLHIQVQVRHQLLQTAILVERAVQFLRIRGFHSSVLAALSVERRLRDSVLTAQVSYHPPSFSLLQNPNDLSLSKQTFPHVILLAPCEFGRTLFLTGLDLGGRSKTTGRTWQKCAKKPANAEERLMRNAKRNPACGIA